MSATAHAAVDEWSAEAPIAKPTPEAKIVMYYGLATAVLAALAVLFLGFAFIFPPMNEAWTEVQTYGASVPVIAAAALCMVFAILLLTLRRPWAMVGCAAGSAAVALTAWIAFVRVLGSNPLSLGLRVLDSHFPLEPFFTKPFGFMYNIVAIPGIVIACGGLFVIPAGLVAALSWAMGRLQSLPAPLPLLAPHVRKVGTLHYTLFGLALMFVWLLWGDFVYSLSDTHMPDILSFKLKDMKASDTLNIVLNKTLALTVAFLFAPGVSFASDRFRSKWGRRIPFLRWSTPFVGLFLVLIGCYESITDFITGGAESVKLLGMNFSRVGVALFVFGVLFVLYDLSNIFVGTLYWYLFNDVVPSRVMAQFLSFFRIVGNLAGVIYSGFIFPHALTHFRILFIAAGVFYALGYLLMCYMVREGRYPPPPPLVVRNTSWGEVWASVSGFIHARGHALRRLSWHKLSVKAALLAVPVAIALGIVIAFGSLCVVGMGLEFLVLGLVPWVGRRLVPSSGPAWLRKPFASKVSGFFVDLSNQGITFAKECFTHKFYWFFFLQSTFFFVSWQAGYFGGLRNRDSIHISLDDLGKLGAISGFVSLLMQYPAGWLSDRWNPVRVFMLTTFITFGQNFLQLIFLIWPLFGWGDFAPNTALAIMALFSFTLMPFSQLHGAAEIPMYMRLLPRERYGQFCSANAMLRSLAQIFGSLSVGPLFDWLSHTDWIKSYGENFHYRFYPIWVIFFQIFAFYFLWRLYREWKARGGDKGYTPPPVDATSAE
ncbi:MAG: hypothetical protein ACE15C_11490 [Phycisphaerae bacterium]